MKRFPERQQHKNAQAFQPDGSICIKKKERVRHLPGYWWRPQCRLKATLFISLLHLESPAMSTGSPGRCRTLSFFLIHFLSLYFSRFSVYFNIMEVFVNQKKCNVHTTIIFRFQEKNLNLNRDSNLACSGSGFLQGTKIIGWI